jgi:glycosyltransferase involved in cell wall biosynthesis
MSGAKQNSRKKLSKNNQSKTFSMRIGVDIRTLMDEQYSGVSWYTLDLLTEILRQDKINDYKLFYNSGHDVSGRVPALGKEIVATRYPNKFFNYLLQKFLHRPKLDELCGKVDVFWQPHINFSSFSVGTKVILTVHDLSFLVFPEFFSWRKCIWHRFMGLEGLIGRADVIIAISESTKNDIIRFFPSAKDKVRVVYSGCGPEFVKLPADDPRLLEVKRKYGLGDNIVLSIGTAEPRKNAAGLIKAFDEANLYGWQLVLAGASGWKNKAFHKAIKEAKNKENIKLLGYVDKDDRPYLYNLAKVFAYPSFYEGFGLPVLEAMACGTPVITSAVSSLPEIAGDAAVLVSPDNDEDLSVALKSLVKSDGMRDWYSAKGLSRAKDFTWRRTAEEYLSIFNCL